jgi:molybdate transport system substrate-binding protein
MKAIFITVMMMIASALSTPAAVVNVYAAISLGDALRAMQPDYERASSDTLKFNLAGSNVLALQIMKGAPADVFFSADEAQMDKLGKAGVIDPATRRNIVFNRLVVVVPVDSQLQITSLDDLANPEIKHLSLADPRAVPAGVYAKHALEDAGTWDKVQARVVPGINVRAALAAVESGSAEAGMVYATDAQGNTKTRVIYTVPDSAKIVIAYPAAMVKSSTQAAAARKFIAYLQTDAARAELTKYGFIVGANPQPK